MATPQFTNAARRARLVDRHCLDGSAPDALAAVRSVVAMHSSDPVTPYLGVLARTQTDGYLDLDAALYDERTLWRLHAMRRTLFVVAVDDAPIVREAAGRDVAAAERRKLQKLLAAAGPPADDPGWLLAVEQRTLAALDGGEQLRTPELSAAVPELATPITVGSGRWTTEVSLASRLLFLLALDGHLVRTRPAGSWRSSQYRWSTTAAWFGPTARPPDPDVARAALARRYLAAHGPATLADLRWWTGWTAVRTRAALTTVDPVEVTLEGGTTAFVLPDDLPGEPEPAIGDAPMVALLPGLDPTPMGWKQRAWYLADHTPRLFDTNGNAGPTIWVDGRVVGGWGQREDGEVVTGLLEDVGADATAQIEQQAAALTTWLDGAVVSPRFRTPLERELATG